MTRDFRAWYDLTPLEKAAALRGLNHHMIVKENPHWTSDAELVVRASVALLEANHGAKQWLDSPIHWASLPARDKAQRLVEVAEWAREISPTTMRPLYEPCQNAAEDLLRTRTRPERER